MFYNIVEWIILLQVACFCTLKVKAVSRTNIILVQKFKENDEPEKSKENKNTLHSYEKEILIIHTFLFNIVVCSFSFLEFTTTCDVLHYHVLLAFWFICCGLVDIFPYPTRHCAR